MKRVPTIILILCLFLSALSIPIVYATEDSWVSLEPMPTARYDFGVAVVDEKIYVIGGDRSGPNPSLGNNEMYEPATDTWTTKEPMPTARRNFGITVFENEIYVMGGDSSSGGPLEENEVYEPETNSWETKASLPTDRMGLCLETVDDLIYAIGGNRHGVFPVLSPLNEVYNPLTDSWTTGAYMPNFEGLGFADITSVVVDNKIYVFSCGEREGNGIFTQIYNTETDTWSSGAPIPIMIDYASAVLTSGIFAPKRIHVLGVHYDGHEGESAHQIYDPIQDTWTNGTALSLPRGSLGLATINDLLYATGGYYESIPISNKNERYTPLGYIPEFPSWFIITVGLLTLTLLSVIYKRGLKQWRKK
ncbi:Kelch repeat-containing protein [Thermoproteota archaeon]